MPVIESKDAACRLILCLETDKQSGHSWLDQAELIRLVDIKVEK